MVLQYQKHPTLQNISYLPPGWPTYTANAGTGQRFAMFYPPGDAPEGGWPVLLYFHLTNFTQSAAGFSDTSGTSIGKTTSLAWQALNNGVAVAGIQVTAGNPVTPAISGNGLWHPPGTGTGAHARRFEDSTYQCFMKDAVMAMQHIRYNADTYNINPEKVGVYGRSAAAHISAYLALSPNLANSFGSGGQHDVNTVPNTFFLYQVAIGFWRHYEQNNGSVPSEMFANFATSVDTEATLLNQVSDSYQDTFAWPSWLAGSGGAYIPKGVVWTETASPSDIWGDEGNWETEVADETALHSAWHFALLKSLFPDRVYFGQRFSSITTATNTFLDFILNDDYASFYTNAEGADPYISAAAFVKDPIAQHFLTHIHDPRWDIDPPDGVGRSGDVETTGRYIVPAHPKRKRLIVHVAGDDVFVGSTPSTCDTPILENTTKEIFTAGKLYAKAQNDNATITSSEMFSS